MCSFIFASKYLFLILNKIKAMQDIIKIEKKYPITAHIQLNALCEIFFVENHGNKVVISQNTELIKTTFSLNISELDKLLNILIYFIKVILYFYIR